MTAPRRDGNESAFSDWIRRNPELDSIKERLSVHDTDYWIHQHRAHTDKIGERKIDSIFLLELKTYCAEMRIAQRDTIQLISAMYRKLNYTKDGKCKTVRLDMGNEIRIVRMYGYFVLRLSGDRPDMSQMIEWNGRQIDEATLTEILNFSRDPRSLRLRCERRHHSKSVRQIYPDLFSVVA